MIPTYLSEHLRADDRTVVFPSEVAAAFWRRSYLRETGRPSIRADRIISWDAFKERYFGRRHTFKPVNALMRTMFAVRFLEDHRRNPSLTTLVPPAYADDSPRFLTNIRAVLPLLPELERRSSGAADFAQDLRTVRAAYEGYLNDTDSFEPGWVAIGEIEVDSPHVILFPALLEDFEEFRRPIEASPHVRLVRAPTATSGIRLRQFADSRREIGAILAQIESLLDAGTSPSQIAVTIPGVEEIAETLEQESRRREVPLIVRSGAALADYPAGRLFAGIAACRRSRFSLDSVKEFLLDRGIPFRNRRAHELLVRFGAETGCLANGRRDLWATAFRSKSNRLLSSVVAEERDGLSEEYRRFSRAVAAIADAPSFSEIKRLLYAFLRAFIATDEWDGTNERVFQRSIELLDELDDAAAGHDVPQPFALFVRMLGESTYVPRADSGGINVYPYRVSAGIAPRHHFILNASRRTSDVQIDPFPFLSDPLREALGVQPTDATEAFWNVYEQSGSEVHASYAEVSAVGPELAPGRFVAGERIEHQPTHAPENTDRFRLERAYWAGGIDSLDELYPVQRRGFERATVSAFAPAATDMTSEPLDGDGLVAAAMAAQLQQSSAESNAGTHPRRTADAQKASRVGVTPSHLEAFVACPFSYFFSRVVALEEHSWTADIERPQDIGSFYHRVLEVFFAEIRQRGTTIHADQKDSAATRLRELIEQEAAGYARRSTALHPLALAARFDRITDDLSCLVFRELDRLSGYRVYATEAWYDSDAVDGVHLYGKIDRIDVDPATGSAVVLDYKKGAFPAPADVTGRKRNGDRVEPSSYQIPFYLALAEASGLSVGEAGYESVERRTYKPVYATDGKRYFGDDEWPDVRARLFEAITQMISDIRRGDYRCRREDCEGCAFRALCRRKFVVTIQRESL